MFQGQTGVIVEHLRSADPCALHTEVRCQVIHRDEGGRVALLQQSPALLVVLLRIHTGSLQHIPQLESVSQCALHYQVDVSTHKVVGMAVVRTQHHHVRTLVNQRTQQLVVLSGTSLADNHLHASPDARPSFLQCRALMVGSHARSRILVALVSHHSGCMSVHGLVVAQCSLNLGHHLLVASQHTRIVHHLAQETNVLASHERLRSLGVNHRSAGLYVATHGRHAARCTKQEVESSLLARAYHVVHALNA